MDWQISIAIGYYSVDRPRARLPVFQNDRRQNTLIEGKSVGLVLDGIRAVDWPVIRRDEVSQLNVAVRDPLLERLAHLGGRRLCGLNERNIPKYCPGSDFLDVCDQFGRRVFKFKVEAEVADTDDSSGAIADVLHRQSQAIPDPGLSTINQQQRACLRNVEHGRPPLFARKEYS